MGPMPNTYHPSQFRAQVLWVNNPSQFRAFVDNRGRVFRYFYLLSRFTTWVANPIVIRSSRRLIGLTTLTMAMGAPIAQDKCGPYSGTRFEAVLPWPNPLGIAAGTYPFYITGWKWTTDRENMTRGNVGVIYKGSGINPRTMQALPSPDEYGVNRRMGRQPWFLNYPIEHASCHNGAVQAAKLAKMMWED